MAMDEHEAHLAAIQEAELQAQAAGMDDAPDFTDAGLAEQIQAAEQAAMEAGTDEPLDYDAIASQEDDFYDGGGDDDFGGDDFVDDSPVEPLAEQAATSGDRHVSDPAGTATGAPSSESVPRPSPQLAQRPTGLQQSGGRGFGPRRPSRLTTPSEPAYEATDDTVDNHVRGRHRDSVMDTSPAPREVDTSPQVNHERERWSKQAREGGLVAEDYQFSFDVEARYEASTYADLAQQDFTQQGKLGKMMARRGYEPYSMVKATRHGVGVYGGDAEPPARAGDEAAVTAGEVTPEFEQEVEPDDRVEPEPETAGAVAPVTEPDVASDTASETVAESPVIPDSIEQVSESEVTSNLVDEVVSDVKTEETTTTVDVADDEVMFTTRVRRDIEASEDEDDVNAQEFIDGLNTMSRVQRGRVMRELGMTTREELDQVYDDAEADSQDYEAKIKELIAERDAARAEAKRYEQQLAQAVSSVEPAAPEAPVAVVSTEAEQQAPAPVDEDVEEPVTMSTDDQEYQPAVSEDV